MLEWMGLNFQYYDGLQPKIRAGIINEHECNMGIVLVSENHVHILFVENGIIGTSGIYT